MKNYFINGNYGKNIQKKKSNIKLIITKMYHNKFILMHLVMFSLNAIYKQINNCQIIYNSHFIICKKRIKKKNTKN